MAINRVLLHVADIERSINFYRDYLDAEVVGEATVDAAELDFVSTVIELRRLEGGRPASRQEDDLFRGFRHLGFKVADIDPIVSRLRDGGIEIVLGPGFAPIGKVHLAFFDDPDGTRLEIVDGHLEYEDIHDKQEDVAERLASKPDRPRFDHIAQTCSDLRHRSAELRGLSFTHVGTLRHRDERDFTLNYFRSGEGVIEVFTFNQPTETGSPRVDEYGFVAVAIDDGVPEEIRRIGSLGDGRRVVADRSDLTYLV